MKYFPIKGWDASKFSKEEMGGMQDFLFNKYLAKEVTEGGQKSVDNLEIVHNGLKQHVKGYDFRTTTDDQGCFSGTSWQTGRVKIRLCRNGVSIFLDDNRSDIISSGFCFCNVVVVDQYGHTEVAMGAMMMTKSEASVFCILSSIVSMNPEAVDIVKALLSDIGKVYTSYLFFCRHIAISHFFFLLFMVIGIREEPSYGTLINLEWLGACKFHIIVIYLSNNMGHLP